MSPSVLIFFVFFITGMKISAPQKYSVFFYFTKAIRLVCLYELEAYKYLIEKYN